MNASVNADDAAAAREAMVAYLTHKLHVLQLFLLCGYGVMFLLCVALIAYLRHNRHVALRGDAAAARKVILPAFEPLLWILGAATGTYTVFFATALGVGLFTREISRVSSELFYCGRQFVFVCVLVFLYQKSVSIPALRRTLFVSFLLSTYTIPIVWYVATYAAPTTDFYVVLMAVRAPLLLLYAFVLVRPPGRASTRTLREYCAFAVVYYALLFTYIELIRRRQLDAAFAFAYANLTWGALCPLVIWRVLKADTEYWRGLGQRAVALQDRFRQRREAGALDERVSSQGLHVLIELHRKYIIDFAYLELQEQIGTGASSTVVRGVLHSKTPVAVKLYAPREFTEETVAAFSHEAALCGALHHPNVVKFYGMCVCPPTIALVSELCLGSLDDVLRAVHARRHSNPDRQQFLLNLCYMLDAARAVAYLHSFSPPFVHRDIKPSNFLIDYKSTVKLTDFGESRSLPRAHHAAPPLHPYMVLASGARYAAAGGGGGGGATAAVAGASAATLLSASGGPGGSTPALGGVGGVGAAGGGGGGGGLGDSMVRAASVASMTVRGTVDYMAPEVIQGRGGAAAYAQAADVYSLAVTMWDILHPGKDKFPALRQHPLRIFESVIEGKRPKLEDHVHASLRDVIESAWHGDERLRPSGQNIVHILEHIQEESQAVYAAQLLSEIDSDSAALARARGSRAPADFSFTGAEAVSHMVDSGYALGAGEAVRLGNALMDAGYVHHLRHSRGFVDSTRELYYLDEDNISRCRPIQPLVHSRRRRRCGASPLGGGVGGGGDGDALISDSSDDATSNAPERGQGHDEDEETKAADAPSSSTRGSPPPAFEEPLLGERRPPASHRKSRPLVEQHGLCACRKLGQHLHAGEGWSARRGKRKQPQSSRVGTILQETSVMATALTRRLLSDDEIVGEPVAPSGGHVAININGPAAA